MSSVIALHPFIRRFVASIIVDIRAKNFNYEDRQVIYADLVPRVSEGAMQSSLGRPGLSRVKVDMNELVAPIPLARKIPTKIPVAVHTPFAKPIPKVVKPEIKMNKGKRLPIDLGNGYGQITLLLNDASVSSIECNGVGNPVMVVQMGRKQMTNIFLSKEEIDAVLEKISGEVHIPLLDGVFRAAVDGFSISAIISGMIGSRFVIKKAAAF